MSIGVSVSGCISVNLRDGILISLDFIVICYT